MARSFSFRRIMNPDRWPGWVPHPDAWLSAICLTLLTGGLAAGAAFAWQIALFLARISPRLGLVFGVAAVLSPVIFVAIGHHLLHLILERFFPETKIPGLVRHAGILPGLISWWKGLYSWLVIILSTLIATAILGAIPLSLSFMDDILHWWDRARPLFRVSTLVWVLIAAYLYHFEGIVQRRWISMTPPSDE